MVTLEPNDINLEKFLKFFTLASDNTPGTKIVLADVDFLKIASLLKLELQVRRLVQK